jgi:hypothetical protein
VLPLIKSKYLIDSVIVIRTIHSAGIGESSVDELVSELEKMGNPTVGLAAHPGQVDIRITAKAANNDQAWELIKPVEAQVKQLLGNYVYGEDEMTLERVISDQLKLFKINLKINYESSLTEIANLISGWLYISADHRKVVEKGQLITHDSSMYNHMNGKEMVMNLKRQENTNKGLYVDIIHLGKVFNKSIIYGGHPSQFNQCAGNHILNFLREIILGDKGAK